MGMLIHLCLASNKKDIQKQCRPQSDAAEQESDQGLHCLHQIQEFLLNTALMKNNQTSLLLEMDHPKS